jgi:hypothetical protein
MATLSSPHNRFFRYCVAAFGCFIFAGCSSQRYLGAVGRDGTYANRGYGIVLSLSQLDLSSRWTIADPENMEQTPPSFRPEIRHETIDLDGDGQSSSGEVVLLSRPTVVLFARNSTTTAILLDVKVVSGRDRARPLEALLRQSFSGMRGVSPRLAQNVPVETSTKTAQNRSLSMSASVKANAAPRFYRLVAMDQPEFLTEDGATRRQVVFIFLVTDEPSEALTRDQNTIVENVTLQDRADPKRDHEKW